LTDNVLADGRALDAERSAFQRDLRPFPSAHDLASAHELAFAHNLASAHDLASARAFDPRR
jgi:hypothetical protein